MAHGSRNPLIIDEDFLFGPVATGANDYYTHETGTNKIGNVTMVGVNAGSFVFTTDEPGVGGGGNKVFTNDEYAYGERSSGNWLRSVISDATVPTS